MKEEDLCYITKIVLETGMTFEEAKNSWAFSHREEAEMWLRLFKRQMDLVSNLLKG